MQLYSDLLMFLSFRKSAQVVFLLDLGKEVCFVEPVLWSGAVRGRASGNNLTQCPSAEYLTVVIFS